METESIIGQIGGFLVFRFTVGKLKSDAECLVQIPEQIAVDRAVIGPPEYGIGDGRNVIVRGIVDPDTGMTVEAWLQVNESFDKAACGGDRLPGNGIEGLEDGAIVIAERLPRIHFTFKSEGA